MVPHSWVGHQTFAFIWHLLLTACAGFAVVHLPWNSAMKPGGPCSHPIKIQIIHKIPKQVPSFSLFLRPVSGFIFLESPKSKDFSQVCSNLTPETSKHMKNNFKDTELKSLGPHDRLLLQNSDPLRSLPHTTSASNLLLTELC